MSTRLLIATRKGLFVCPEDRDGFAIHPPAFLGEPVSAVLHDPRDGTLYAALRLGHFGVKLHRSADGGATWEEAGVPAIPAEGEKPKALDMIWTLATGEPGAIYAGTLPAAMFRSADRGASWQIVPALWDVPERAKWMGGGYDDPGLHSIVFDPRDPRRIAIAISTGGVWRSDDGGESWSLGGKGLRAEYMPPDQAFDPLVQDVHLLAACAAAPDTLWAQHHNGIFRSTDRGASFAEVTAEAPSRFGFCVAPHPRDPLTAWFVPAVKDECRVAVGGRMAVMRTRDGGRSLEALTDGLPQSGCFDLVYRHALAVDAQGRRLAMGSTTGNLWISGDGGERWRHLAAHLPPVAAVAFCG
jgi:photosystem II stability/assembly factor-like uncharacterized protein